jgi:hypothetical protein
MLVWVHGIAIGLVVLGGGVGLVVLGGGVGLVVLGWWCWVGGVGGGVGWWCWDSVVV